MYRIQQIFIYQMVAFDSISISSNKLWAIQADESENLISNPEFHGKFFYLFLLDTKPTPFSSNKRNENKKVSQLNWIFKLLTEQKSACSAIPFNVTQFVLKSNKEYIKMLKPYN